MTYKIVISPEAESDLLEAYWWYEGRLRGLGKDLMDFVEVGIDQVAENPFLFPEIYRNIRRHLLRKYPYAILFTVEV